MSLAELLEEEDGPFSKEYGEIVELLEKHSSDKVRIINGDSSRSTGVDLFIVDVPEGLPLPTIFIPDAVVPKWNKFSPDWLQFVFDFVDNYLVDSSALLVLYPFSRDVKSNLLGYFKTFGFRSKKDW